MPLPYSRSLVSKRWPQLAAGAFGEFANLPLLERVNDRLADAMVAIDEAMQICEEEGGAAYDKSWLGPQILAAFEQVNCIMKKISD
ncbi:MAG: hypothetical protein QOC81_997 [Thermoanaerobaculia bacterium]|jgi:hypothetical protein|nr:hypothetical protein [Thermoanaerobaculia bacterium]